MLNAARAEFHRRLLHLTPDNSGAATPCPEWTALDLVNHVVAGDRMAADLLDGATAEAAVATLRAQWLGDDPLAAFTSAGTDLDRAIAVPGALDAIVPHPVGPVPGHQAVTFRVTEHLVHAWDLARALDLDDTLDPELVEHTWETLHGMAAVIGTLGIFGTGPSGTLDETSPLQDRLLDLLGRRPGA
ncbi:TIGR03086 family metal-binding protein [Actinokineospora globicatena]|uniref:Mycothiol-dependent maleylpyruvate isomerase metal-binding domain-containing protein n=1 Tax=Actinokineospora globicatena TaxID=103729 RepID=A0A9W6V5B8_9PSEU|nr:TIGR03086 family metal-binding protein [Actinokineospora globicatena]GLW90170.1 hypothetical protein Aglo03_09860 [Actinokineospora globicatena]